MGLRHSWKARRGMEELNVITEFMPIAIMIITEVNKYK